jgi:hypothetical protein
VPVPGLGRRAAASEDLDWLAWLPPLEADDPEPLPEFELALEPELELDDEPPLCLDPASELADEPPLDPRGTARSSPPWANAAAEIRTKGTTPMILDVFMASTSIGRVP